ncbi:MAG: GNAT family N-acetyltransferase [Oscillospiraceae bacterium]
MLKNIWYNEGEDFSPSKDVRTKVFVIEQGYPLELEFDDLDEICPHIVVFDELLPIATGRIVKVDETTAKLGRIAVLKEYRGQHIGERVVTALIEKATDMGFSTLKISAQTYATAFYEKFGFKKYGSEYLDVHLLHIDMIMIAEKNA